MKLLKWLDDPASDRGIHFAAAQDEWAFSSYAELARDARRVAALLAEQGAVPGRPVSLMLSAPRDFIAGFFGTILAGATPSPVAAPLTFRGRDVYVQHVAGVLDVATPSVVLTDKTLADTVEDSLKLASGTAVPVVLDWSVAPSDADIARRGLADTVLLQFTSGSSGRPKGVRVSPENLDGNVEAINDWGGMVPGEVFTSWLPLHHDMGLVGALLCPVTSQNDLWLMTPDQFVRHPLRWLTCVGLHGATMTTAPSFGYSYAQRRIKPEQLEGMDLSGLRLAILGAERIDPVGIAKFTALTRPFGFRPESLVAAYGIAEATLAVTGVRPGVGSTVIRLAEVGRLDGEPVTVVERRQLGADEVTESGWLAGCGTPLSGVEVRIVDEAGNDLPAGRFGEIVVSGTSVAQGYRTRSVAQSYPTSTSAPEESAPEGATAFTDQGLHTGDSGFLLDGQLYVVGRLGDSIKVRGRKLHAEDLEVNLAATAGQRADRCAVVAGTVAGHDVVAAVVEDTCTDWLSQVVSMMRSVTADSVCIAVFHGANGCVERTSSGKPRRRVTWQHLLDGSSKARLIYTNWSEVSSRPMPWPGTDAPSVVPGTPAATRYLDHYPRCLGCGTANERGLRLQVAWNGSEGECVHVPPPYAEGGPGIVHGGYLAAVVDEVTALVAAEYAGEPTMTLRTEIDYRAPVPIGRSMRIRSRVAETGKRRIILRLEATGAEGSDDGTFLAARVVCLRVPRSRWLGRYPEQRQALDRLGMDGGDPSTFLRWQLKGGLQQFVVPARSATQTRVLLEVTDAAPGRWLLVVGPDGFQATVEPSADKAWDATFRGPFQHWLRLIQRTADLDALLDDDSVRIEGNRDSLRALAQAFDLGG